MAYDDDDNFEGDDDKFDDDGENFEDDDLYSDRYKWTPKDPYEKEREKAKQRYIKSDPGVNPLLHLTGKDVMEVPGAKTPVPLFGELWYQGDIAVMFADTGNGKSTLGVQIAESIARGVPVPPFTHSVEPQSVLYVDFEMPLSQFQNRYGALEPGHYTFSENFTRADPGFYSGTPEVFDSLASHMRWAMGQSLQETGARVLIVDHISFFDLVSTQDAMRMRTAMRKLRRDRQSSILLIAHTPKRRHRSPLTLNDLHGSKMLSNFADSMFAIGRCGRDREVRYIKHIKSRFSASRFDGERVIAYRVRRTPGLPTLGSGQVVEKRDDYGLELPAALGPADVPPLLFDSPEISGGFERPAEATPDAKPNFMAFDFIGYAAESDLLSNPLKNTARDQLISRARDLHLAGVSMSKIARQLNISKATVGRFCLGMPKAKDDDEKNKTDQRKNGRDKNGAGVRIHSAPPAADHGDLSRRSAPDEPPPAREPEHLPKPRHSSQGF